jgi:hypothetical protein
LSFSIASIHKTSLEQGQISFRQLIRQKAPRDSGFVQIIAPSIASFFGFSVSRRINAQEISVNEIASGPSSLQALPTQDSLFCYRAYLD